jgi:hypothetical protein
MALHLRDQELSLREVAARLVVIQGREEGPAPLSGDRHANDARARRQTAAARPVATPWA